MRKLIWILLLTALISCKEECNETEGTIIQQEIEVASFDKIIVNSGIELTIKDGPTQQVIITAGENRLDNIHTSVTDNTLELQADGACYFNPSLKPVKVHISSPNLRLIRNSSDFQITSDGTLSYPEIQLISEDYESDYSNFGNFDIKINNTRLTIISNGHSIFTISGSTNELGLYYYSGIGKFEGADLIANQVKVYHRGDNSLKVNPQESLKGDILGTGDLISFNRPPIVEVEEHFMGKLIFE